ncbi:MAG: hypothetical protein IPK58_06190 [Acidobacteria bacterium]|nr:hypothetical protein [Acidobacteriota bacterium]
MNIKLIVIVLALAVGAFGQTSVTVGSGSGDGRFRGQQIVDVWADPYPAGQIFDRWVGDTHLLARPDEWHAKVRTGTKNINLNATYRTVPAWLPVGPENIGSTQMRYFFPANPVGVVFHFHGSGGSMNGLFSSSEQTIFARELVAEGYAVVSMNSSDRVNAQWNTSLPPNNPDVINVEAAIASFISRGLITNQTPVFASGISNGGAFAPRVSLFLGFRGTAVYIATSNATIMQNTTAATIWCIMQNDSTLAPGSVQEALNNYNVLRSRGIRAEYNVLRPSPVFPERFRRIPGLNTADSINIYNALKNNGFLDSRDLLRQNPISSGWQAVVPAQYNGNLPDILDQLKVCYTEHQFFSDYNRRVISFFNSIL